MVLPRFAEKFLFRTNKLTGLEIVLTGESEFLINCCICERSGTKISVPFSKENITSVDELAEVLPAKKLPVSIVFNGKGIMHKKIQVSENETVSSAFHKVFPTGTETDFYTQLYHGLPGQGFCSVIRRSKVDEILKMLETKGYPVIEFFLGPFIVEDALVLMASETSVFDLEWGSHALAIEDKKVKDILSGTTAGQQQNFQFGDFSVTTGILLSFCAAFHYFLPVARITHNNATAEQTYSNYQYATAFRKLLTVSVAFVLLVALGNFFLYLNYFKKQKKLDEELSVYQASASKYRQLSQELDSKKKFLEKEGVVFSTQTSFYTDRLVYDLPDDIQLSYFSLFPLKKAIEKDSVAQFSSKEISIKGTCSQSIILNGWLNLLRTKEFVREAILNNYENDPDLRRIKFYVTVKLK